MPADKTVSVLLALALCATAVAAMPVESDDGIATAEEQSGRTLPSGPPDDVPRNDTAPDGPPDDVPRNDTAPNGPPEDVPRNDTAQSGPPDDVPRNDTAPNGPPDDVPRNDTAPNGPPDDVPRNDTVPNGPPDDVPRNAAPTNGGDDDEAAPVDSDDDEDATSDQDNAAKGNRSSNRGRGLERALQQVPDVVAAMLAEIQRAFAESINGVGATLQEFKGHVDGSARREKASKG